MLRWDGMGWKVDGWTDLGPEADPTGLFADGDLAFVLSMAGWDNRVETESDSSGGGGDGDGGPRREDVLEERHHRGRGRQRERESPSSAEPSFPITHTRTRKRQPGSLEQCTCATEVMLRIKWTYG